MTTAYPTITAMFAEAAERSADRPALHRQTSRGMETITYRQTTDRVNRLAHWIMAQGGTAGDRIAIVGPNGPDWAIAALATLRAGRVLVPLDMQFTAEEIRGLLEHSEAVGVFLSGKYGQSDALGGIPALRFWPLEEMIREIDTLEGAAGGFPERDPEDLAILLYTSGTSGDPKGVPMTHANTTSNVIHTAEKITPLPTDVWLSLLPLSHGLELCMGLLMPLCNGGSIAYPRSRLPNLIMEAMRETGTTVMVTVPAVLDFFAKAIRHGAPKGVKGALLRGFLRLLPAPTRRRFIAKASGLPIDKIRGLICGGAYLPPDLERTWCRMGLPVVQGYGLTEAGPVISVNTLTPTFSNAGTPLACCDVRIAEANADGVGEIQVRSPGVMSGYYRNPEATSATFTEDGWLKTGDLGKFNERGEIIIAGRSKDVIITGNGLNVYPEEVESRLEDHALVARACVVQKPILSHGRRAQRDGDAVWAVIVLDPEALKRDHPEAADDARARTQLAEEILHEIAPRLAHYKRPAGIDVWEELPITRSGKVQRRRVREALGNGAHTAA